MLISLPRPEPDHVLPGDNVFTPGTGSAFDCWAFLYPNQVETTSTFSRERIHEMSFNPMSLKRTWPEHALKQESQLHQLHLPYRHGYPSVPPPSSELLVG